MRTAFTHTMLILAVALLVLLCASPVPATEYLDIEADNSTMTTGGKAIVTDGKSYPLQTKYDVGLNVFYPDITTGAAYPGQDSSFEFLMDARPMAGGPGEKMMFNFVGDQGPAPQWWGVTHTMSFAVCIAPDFQLQNGQSLMLWEYYQLGSPTGDVISMGLGKNSTTWGITIHLPDWVNGSTTGTVELPGNTLNINQWYFFVVSVMPNYAANGSVTVWQDGVQVINNSSCPIGCNPTEHLPGETSGYPGQNLTVCFGLYRGADKQKAHVYEDLFRWGDTYADVQSSNPTITGISPGAGPLTGGETVTITGKNLSGTSSVTFNGVAATSVTGLSTTSMTCVTPPGVAGTASVVITSPAGSFTSGRDYTYQDVPQITSIAPSAGPLAGGEAVTIAGTDLLGTSSVTFGGAAASSVSAASATSVTCITPPGTSGLVDVVLTTPSGAVTASGVYAYQMAPQITSVSPAVGPMTGGTTVTITGTNLAGVSGVTFAGVAALSVAGISATSVTCISPAGSIGPADVVLTTPSGSVTATQAYTYQIAPQIISISPPAGLPAGGTRVTLTGTNLTGTSSVTFGGNAATSVTVVSATTVICITPAKGASRVNVVLTASTGMWTSPGGYVYQGVPKITAVAPASGQITGGTTVTITGTNLIGTSAVTFGGTAATAVSVVNGTSLTCVTPAGAAGTVDVVLTTPCGSVTSSQVYTFQGSPQITSLSPTVGPMTGGTTVTMTGTDLLGTTSVTFDGNAATAVTVLSATSVTCITPADANSGAVDVVLTTPSGTVTAARGFSYQVAPIITGIAPDAGPLAGGTTVTITGTHLAGTTSVTFAGISATSVTVVSGTTVTCVTPADTAGTVDVVLTATLGVGSAAHAFTYQAAPQISSMKPVSGPLTGGVEVTITGTNLIGTSRVTFGGIAATKVTVVSATTVTCVTPAEAAGVVDVVLTTPIGSWTATQAYTYRTGPSISTLSPSAGPLSGGETVTITGSNLTGTGSVTFDGILATSVVVLSDTSVTCVTPADATGTVDVVLTTSNGPWTSPQAFTYQAMPQITSIAPITGPLTGGTTVTISGGALTGTSTVTFGGIPATSVTVVSDASVTCVTPAEAIGTVDVVLTASGGSVTSPGAFTFQWIAPPSPTIVWAAPAQITYGTALSAIQLNATTSPTVAGTFVYSPALGTVLQSGTGMTLSVTFTPTDTVDYSSATAAVTIDVATASLTITADNQTMAPGAPVPTLTAAYEGFVNGDTLTSLTTPSLLSTTATSSSPDGVYPITVSGATDPNYVVTFVPGELIITTTSGTSPSGSAPGGGGCGSGSGVSALVGVLLMALRLSLAQLKRQS